MPKKDKLLDVGPIAETQTRAAELVIIVETGVLGREGMRDGGLADVLAVLAEEPLDACLVGGTGGLGVGPAAEGASLVEGQRVPLLGGVRGGRRVVVAVGEAGELGVDIRTDIRIVHVCVDVRIEVGIEAGVVEVGIGREFGVDVGAAGVAVVDADVYIYADLDINIVVVVNIIIVADVVPEIDGEVAIVVVVIIVVVILGRRKVVRLVLVLALLELLLLLLELVLVLQLLLVVILMLMLVLLLLWLLLLMLVLLLLLRHADDRSGGGGGGGVEGGDFAHGERRERGRRAKGRRECDLEYLSTAQTGKEVSARAAPMRLFSAD